MNKLEMFLDFDKPQLVWIGGWGICQFQACLREGTHKRVGVQKGQGFNGEPLCSFIFIPFDEASRDVVVRIPS